MKIAVVGSTQINSRLNLDVVVKYLKSLPIGTQILTGSSLGVDRFVAQHYPKRRGFRLRVYQPNWERFGQTSVDMENKKMINESDIVAVCWNGVSPGSKSIIEECKKIGKDTEVIMLKNELMAEILGRAKILTNA